MKSAFSIKARIIFFGYALHGFKVLLKEPNFVIHSTISILVIVLGIYFQIKKIEWLFLILTIGFVLFVEAINTSLEYLVDLVSPKYHVLAKKCKDVAAMAVLLSAITAVLIGGIIFIPYFTTIMRFE